MRLTGSAPPPPPSAAAPAPNENELLCCYCCLPAATHGRMYAFYFIFLFFFFSFSQLSVFHRAQRRYRTQNSTDMIFYIRYHHIFMLLFHTVFGVSRIGDSNHIDRTLLTFFSFRFHFNRPPKFHISLMSSLHNHTHFSSYQNNQKQTNIFFSSVFFFFASNFAGASSFFLRRFFLSSIIHTNSFFDIYLYIFLLDSDKTCRTPFRYAEKKPISNQS